MSTQTGSIDLKGMNKSSQTASKYITEINNGITVHPTVMVNGSHYTQTDGNGFYIKQYVDGINDISLGEYTGSTIQLNNGIQGLLINETGIKIQENSIPIAQFGTVTQIGADDNAKIRMTPTNLQILTSQKVQAFGVDTTAREETLEVSIQLSDEELINIGAMREQSVTKTVTLGLNNHSEISNEQDITLKFSSSFIIYLGGRFWPLKSTFDITLTKGQNKETANPILITVDEYDVGTYSYTYIASTDQFTITLEVASTPRSGGILCDHYITAQNAYVPEITLNGEIHVNDSIWDDFTTEQGSVAGNHGTWYYRKWKNGMVEAWYNMDTAISVSFAGGSSGDSAAGTYRKASTATIPSGIFSTTPIFGYVNTTQSGTTIHANIHPVSATEATVYWTRDASGNANITANIYLMGFDS